MFDAYCRHCRARVLLTTRRILSLHNTSQGILVYFRCWCGTPGIWITGRRRKTAPPAAKAQPGPAVVTLPDPSPAR